MYCLLFSFFTKGCSIQVHTKEPVEKCSKFKSERYGIPADFKHISGQVEELTKSPSKYCESSPCNLCAVFQVF